MREKQEEKNRSKYELNSIIKEQMHPPHPTKKKNTTKNLTFQFTKMLDFVNFSRPDTSVGFGLITLRAVSVSPFPSALLK